jgi:hypothetical protein
MGKVARKRAERTLDGAVEVLDQARAALVKRLDNVDLTSMQKRGTRWAGSVRSDLERRARPRRRRVSPWTVAGITGLVVLGAAAVGVGYVAYDRERRDAVQRRLGDVRQRARERYAELVGGQTEVEADLEARVRQAIAEGGTPPEGLEVVVEGRTAYLRGAVSDPAFVDAGAERVHSVPGVVAVVNLTTSAAEDKRSRSAQRA